MKRRVCEHPPFSFLQGGSASLFFLKNPGFCGQIKVFSALYLRGKERRASTASVATLANFALGNPFPLNTKLLVGILPNPYAERTVPPYGKAQTPHHPALPGNTGRTQPNRAEDGPAPDKADRRLPAEDGNRRIYHLCGHQGH